MWRHLRTWLTGSENMANLDSGDILNFTLFYPESHENIQAVNKIRQWQRFQSWYKHRRHMTMCSGHIRSTHMIHKASSPLFSGTLGLGCWLCTLYWTVFPCLTCPWGTMLWEKKWWPSDTWPLFLLMSLVHTHLILHCLRKRNSCGCFSFAIGSLY